MNLNNIEPVNDGFHRLDPNNVEAEVASVSAFFRNIKSELISAINKSDAVFGCVAWLTDKSILDAIRGRENSSIVVKNDPNNNYLKSETFKGNWIKIDDLASESNYFHALSHSYKIPIGPGGYPLSPAPVRPHCPELPIEKIRVLDVDSAKSFACDEKTNETSKYPLMLHNKFLIFCKVIFAKSDLTAVSNGFYASNSRNPYSQEEYLRIFGKPIVQPYAVWTGSFNFSDSASNHLENAVLIYNKAIAEAYFKEFSLIYHLSQAFIPPAQISEFIV